MGGSVPLVPWSAPPDADDYCTDRELRRHQHAANENLRLQNLWDGVGTMAALLEMQ